MRFADIDAKYEGNFLVNIYKNKQLVAADAVVSGATDKCFFVITKERTFVFPLETEFEVYTDFDAVVLNFSYANADYEVHLRKILITKPEHVFKHL